MAAAPRSRAKMAAACESPANSTPSALNVNGPIDWNVGAAAVALASGAAVGTPEANAAMKTARQTLNVTDLIRPLLSDCQVETSEVETSEYEESQHQCQ